MSKLVSGRMLRMLRMLGAFYPSVCTVQAKTATRDAFGQEQATWAAVSGLSDLASRLAPVSEREERMLGTLVVLSTHVVALAGHYPEITPEMRALVDGQAYDITGVRHDGQGMTTYLAVKVVE